MKPKLFFKSRIFIIGIVILSIICLLLVCYNKNILKKTKEISKINVSAAVSLKDVMEEIKIEYIKKNQNVEIEYNFCSSGSLQQQIEHGAPADLFLSAAPNQMNALEEKDLILKDTRVDLLKNRVVLIIPSDKNNITSFKDLTKDSVTKIGIGDPNSVPVGVYTMDIFNYYNLFEKIESKLVNGKDVREVLSWVKTKNAEAGVVYETDAKIDKSVKVVDTAPEDSHKPVIYPAAVLKDAKNEQGAKDFLNYLKGEGAKAKFEKFGFTKIQ